MINNRQAGRRNRGRNNNNNGRPNNQNRGGGDSGNRIDSRARGNAAQLLEKYRNMARDAQLSGDRVNTEYYLQFADHYFRVLADNRARQEEAQGGQQMRQRPEPTYDEFGDEYDNGFAGTDMDFDGRGQQGQQVQQRDGNRDNGRDGGRDRDGGRENGQRDNGRDNGGREGRQPYQSRDDNRGEGRNDGRNEGRNEGRRNDYRNDRNDGRGEARGEGRDDGRREEGRRDEGRRDEGRRERQPRRDAPRQDSFLPVAAEDAPQQAAPVAEVAAEPTVEAPRRRGRPPKAAVAAAESVAPEAPAAQAPVEAEAEAPRRGGLRPRRARSEAAEDGAGLDLAVLPPAIARADADNDSAPEEAPRKRTRRARPAAEAAE